MTQINERTLISIHAPKAKKPQTLEEFSYFLAGLIDSDGCIAKPGYVQIDFHANDISVAYYITLKKWLATAKLVKRKKDFPCVIAVPPYLA